MQLLVFVSNGVCRTERPCDEVLSGRRTGQRSRICYDNPHVKSWICFCKVSKVMCEVCKKVTLTLMGPCQSRGLLFSWKRSVASSFLTKNFFLIALHHLIIALFILNNGILEFSLFLCLLQEFRLMVFLKGLILNENTVLEYVFMKCLIL